MPDDEKTTAAEDSAPEESKKKSNPLLTYIIIAVVMITAGYFVGTTLSGGAEGDNDQAIAETEVSDKHGSSSHGDENAGANLDSEIFMMEDIIVNPSQTGGTRFLSVSIGFEVGTPETYALFEERAPIIKDALITILGAKTIEQLTNAKEKEITRFQIRKRVEHLLKVDDIAAVYFTDYILQ